jgi:hypothetical protein
MFGGHPLWEILRVVYRLTKKPYISGGCLIFVGFFWAMLTGTEKTVSRDVAQFRRKEQMNRLARVFRRLFVLRRTPQQDVDPVGVDSRL